ncbi:MAG TPA: YkgJ family cysteine cluster protein [Kofleriaceae bacterium]|nr:YkgJ family cysteine cluster protein [Kofleriaceae bacterium]
MQAVAREVTHRYVDPLTQVWLTAARRIGLGVVRTPDAYAATDGRGTLAIGDDAVLDADDSLAQMIFHELCHSLVEGEAAFAQPDWGMDNTGPDHDWREHACLRTQWVLAGRHGLRGVFAPTTDFRAFWNQLAGDVLADRHDASVIAAIRALDRATQKPWAPALDEALAASAEIAAVAARFAPGPGEAAEVPALWRDVTAPPARHPSGLPAGEAAATCGDCAWRAGARCQQAIATEGVRPYVKIDPAWPACERFEAALDCQTCGACCREAYHSVEVGRRDPVRKKQPQLVVDRGSYLEVQRAGDRCAALAGGTFEPVADPAGAAPRLTRYHCTIYDDRPRTCRDFTLGSAHCLTARRRVGLSL